MNLRIVIAINLLAITAFADTTTSCVKNNPQTYNAYQAVEWYRDSAERKAIYREVFLMGTEKIQEQVQQQHLKPQHWGVIFDIDETVLDNSALIYQRTFNCQNYNKDKFSAFQMTATSLAQPGAVKITCSIQKMGGYVTLVSNRDGSYSNESTHETMLQATIANLKKAGICYNQIVISKNAADKDKNSRFSAVQSGVYSSGMVYSNTLPAHPIIAYFGDNIQDFPHTNQQDMMKQDPNGSVYDLFGKEYFSLPNPMYGSWQSNPYQ